MYLEFRNWRVKHFEGDVQPNRRDGIVWTVNTPQSKAEVKEAFHTMIGITREKIRSGTFDRMIVEHDIVPPLSRADRDRSRRSILEGIGFGEDAWVFAYGSLIWNPAFHFVEKRVGRIHGYHRRFCLRSHVVRGTARKPGLIVALDCGGSCWGILYRIDAKDLELETSLIWEREMATRSYTPRWLKIRTETGAVRAIGFVAERAYEHYAGQLSIDETARIIATASGQLGTCLDYLRSILENLNTFGVTDEQLQNLLALAEDMASGDV